MEFAYASGPDFASPRPRRACSRLAWLPLIFASACSQGSSAPSSAANGGSAGAAAGGDSGLAQGGNSGTSAQAQGGSAGQGASSGGPAQGGISGQGAAGASVTAAGVRWLGRVDDSNAAAPKFAWSGTGFVATVSGSAIAVKLTTTGSSDPVFFQPVIDGTPGTRFSIASGEQTVPLGTGLADSDHLVEVYRESEGKFGTNTFAGFTQGTLKDPPPAPGRLLEIVGDSISAGYGNLGSEQHPNYGADPNGGCRFSTETESAYMTYGAIAARALHADASIIALSGWGAYRDNSNSTSNVLSAAYPDTLGVQGTPAWSFGQQAQVVVINLGTNDFAMGDPGEAPFKGAYSALLATIRGKYPDAWIFCMIGPLLYGTGLTQATTYITAVVADSNGSGDSKVQLLNFGQQNSSLGTGCDYHPNVTVHQAMADALVSAVHGALGW